MTETTGYVEVRPVISAPLRLLSEPDTPAEALEWRAARLDAETNSLRPDAADCRDRAKQCDARAEAVQRQADSFRAAAAAVRSGATITGPDDATRPKGAKG